MIRRAKPIIIVLSLLLLAVACVAQPAVDPTIPLAQPGSSDTGIESQAAREATAIIERAKATAMVLEAQAQATALVQQAEEAVVVAGATQQAVLETPTPGVGYIVQSTPNPNSAVSNAGDDSYTVEIINIAYGGEGGFIVVNFYATKKAVDDFWPGRLSVLDETTGAVYNEVAVMPIVGPLIGRPKEPGQPGYVMFVNMPPGLPPGSLVTVQLGEFRQEHVRVGQ